MSSNKALPPVQALPQLQLLLRSILANYLTLVRLLQGICLSARNLAIAPLSAKPRTERSLQSSSRLPTTDYLEGPELPPGACFSSQGPAKGNLAGRCLL